MFGLRRLGGLVDDAWDDDELKVQVTTEGVGLGGIELARLTHAVGPMGLQHQVVDVLNEGGMSLQVVGHARLHRLLSQVVGAPKPGHLVAVQPLVDGCGRQQALVCGVGVLAHARILEEVHQVCL